MTLIAEAPTRGVLGIPTRPATVRSPFWHRDDPVVAVTHIDPGHDRLQRRFPQSWPHLLRAKALLDGTAALEAPTAAPAALHRERIVPLVSAAATELRQFAEAETAGCDGRMPEVAEQASAAADRMLSYVATGQWPDVVLTPPRPGRGWLFCGPLHTWATRSVCEPLALLLVEPRPDLQVAPDYVDTRIRLIRSAVEQTLGGPVIEVKPPRPAMRVADILLAAGESALGHKNFAHFFPLETPGATAAEEPFTVVFGNVQAERLHRCSLPLLRAYLDRPAHPATARRLLPVSVQWFRGHDLAHFWRLATVGGPGEPLESLTPFERITLEETYADTLGLLSTAAIVDPGPLGDAFAGEMLRYLSRDHRCFADSAAAVLMLGWLAQRDRDLRSDDGRWIAGSVPALSELATVLHGLLWERSDHGLDAVRSAIAEGIRLLHTEVEPLFRSVPTDLDYTFG